MNDNMKMSSNIPISKLGSRNNFQHSCSCLAQTIPSSQSLLTVRHSDYCKTTWHCFQKPNCTVYLVPNSLSFYPMLGTWVGLSKFYVQVLQDCRSEDCVSWEVPWADTGFALLLTLPTRWSFLYFVQNTNQIDITASQIFLL